MSAMRAGLTIWPMAAEMAVCATLAGRIIARHGPRLPAVMAGAALAISSAVLTRLTGASSPAFLSVAYSLFGAGAGLVNPVITYGVMSGVPDGQAGLASGLNSSLRQLGQCLGVAATGTVLAGSLRGSMQSGFLSAARAGWWLMAGCGLCVLVAGLAGGGRRLAPRRQGGRHARTGASSRPVSIKRVLTLPGRLLRPVRTSPVVGFQARHGRPVSRPARGRRSALSPH
jgi:hypothetical protein